MIRLGTVVMGAADVVPTVQFWSRALGYEIVRFPDAADEFTILVPPSRVGTRVAIQRTSTPADDEPRTHIDVIVDSADEQASEVDRLVQLGAAKVAWPNYPDDPDFVVLADPAGNRFCVVDASHG